MNIRSFLVSIPNTPEKVVSSIFWLFIFLLITIISLLIGGFITWVIIVGV